MSKKGFTRGAGAVAGVVLESHLLQVCENHKINVKKKTEPSKDDIDELVDGVSKIIKTLF